MARFSVLLVRPDLVGAQIRGVEVGLRRIEYHAVHAGLGAILVVLNVRLHAAVFVYGEDVSVAGVVVERVPVDIVWWLLGREDEDGSGVGVFLAGRC